MRAYRIPDWGRPPEILEVPEPEPGPGQVVVRVEANGLCHSDALMAQMPASFGVALGWRVPFTLGHEIAGRVAEVGDGVDPDWVGRAVAAVSPASCGECATCRRGAENVCAHGDVGRGFGADGGLAPLVLVGSVRELVPIGDLAPTAAAPLTDAGATSLHAVRRALAIADGPVDTAVVLGVGGLGLFAAQFLGALTDATVIGVDPSPRRREAARAVGVSRVIDGVGDDTVAHLHEATDGEGAAVVLDFVGVDTTILAGTAATRRGGAYGLVGAAGGTLRRPWYGTLPRDGGVFTFQGSDIVDVRDAVALAAEGRISSPVDVFAFDDVARAYELLDAGELDGRAVVVPDAI